MKMQRRLLSKIIGGSCITVAILVSSCRSPRPVQQMELPVFDAQGHRGGRGLMPENTIPAMQKALDLEVSTLEMDCHITRDNQVVLAHDGYINHLFAVTPEGNEISAEEAKKYPLYQMDYEQIRQFDVGSKFYDKFPHQKKLEAHIPLLSEVIDSVQHYLTKNNKPQVFYNIETKSKAAGDNVLHPEPEEFVDLLMAVINTKKITPWVVVQSFDPRTLQVLHAKYPAVRSSLLTDKDTFNENLEKLGFTPAIYSPNAKLVTAELVKKCHDKGMKIIPWTVNTPEEIVKLKKMGVDGIISDYPNLFNEL